MTQSRLTLPTTFAAVVVDELAHFGARGLETGGFLVAPRGGSDVSGIAFAGDRGIVRRPDLLQISERALNALFTYVEERDLWLPCHIHSHRFQAFMSPTDASNGINAEGFSCAIVPDFERPSPVVADWGWWSFASGSWHATSSPRLRDAVLSELVTFDEDGVRDR